ncbi:MAG: rhomboid family intramembrane serine protease [Ignavibacteria bacterium]|nr:rhomboid family intramembrane serine protease [Ignavibacteria bacterium]
MVHQHKKISLSRIFLFFILLSHIVLFFLGTNISNTFAINPHLVIFKIELWRLLSFPLVSLSIAESFLLIYAFWVLGPKVESLFRKNYFTISLITFIFLQGLLTTALFGRENFYLVGTEGLSFYIITLYFFIYYRIISQYEPVPIRSMIQTALVIFFWIMAASLDSFIYKRDTLINSFSFALVGIFLGFLSYLQNRSFALELIQEKYKDFIAFRKKVQELEEEDLEEIAEMFLEQANNSTASLEETKHYTLPFNEETLNKILDKINEKGKESLTPEEIQFLKDYSKKVN